MEAIFLTSEDIRSQLPDDTKRFEQMDSNFKEVMKNAVDVPNCVEVCSFDGLEENLKEMIVDQSNIMREFNDINIIKFRVDFNIIIIVAFFFLSLICFYAALIKTSDLITAGRS